MKIQATDTPQAVFQDGEQTAFSIFNEGPFTVYIDSDSSISSQSLALPPTATIVWDANRPLWVLGASPFSTLLLTRNGQPLNADRASVDATIYRAMNFDGFNEYLSDLIETSAYNSLNIQLSDLEANTGYGLADLRLVTVYWYNHESIMVGLGQPIGGDKFEITPFNWDAQRDSYVNISVPVRGAFCRIWVSGTDPSTQRTSMTVSASSRNVVLGWRYQQKVATPDDVVLDYLHRMGIVNDTAQEVGNFVWEDAWRTNGYPDLVLAPYLPKMQISINHAGSITAAGLVRVIVTGWNIIPIREINIPVVTGSGVIITAPFIVPDSQSVLVRMGTNPTTASEVRLMVAYAET